MEINQKINDFKNDLKTRPVEFIIHKYIEYDESFLLKQDQYLGLKKEIASQFGLHIRDVIMVGSGKLGFSIKPSKRFIPFGDQSDIDLAIISTSLFERLWKEIFTYQVEGGFWPKEENFKKYLFRGWIRPDLLPSGNSFRFAKEWWDFFQKITASEQYGAFKIVGGIYYSFYFFEEYQSICVNQCKREVINENYSHK